MDDVLTLLERAARDALVLDNGNERNRVLASIAGQGLNALLKGDFEKRLAALEASAGVTEEARPTFEIVVPPPGLTREAYDRWSEEVSRDAEAHGVFWFTMNLGDAKLRTG